MSRHEAPASLEDTPPAGCPFHGAGQAAGATIVEQTTESQAPRARHYRPPTGPRPTPILGWRGNVLRYVRQPVEYLTALKERWGNVVALVDGGNEPLIFRPIPGEKSQTVFGFGPEINREVLTQLDVFGGGEFRAPEDAPWINSNMSSVNGERRAQHKAILSPAFARQHLKNYYSDIAEEVERMLDGWASRRQIDLLAEAYALSGRIASRCFYGQAPDKVEGSLAGTIRDFAAALFHPMSAIRLKIPGTPYWRLSRHAAKIRHILSEELRRKEAQGFSGNDALSMMMQAQFNTQVKLTEDEVVGSAVGLYLAGHDVPANGFIFLLSLLTTHPEANERLMQEIDREIGDDLVSYEQIFRLPVLDQVFQESLRIINPAFLIFRKAQKDTTLGDCEVAKGTEVLLSPFMTSRDPKSFTDPGHFRPERWAETNPSSFEFLPFGYGPRRCLGASFVEIQLKLVITRILQRYRLAPVADARLDFKYTFAVHPKGKLVFDIGPQDRNFAKGRRHIGGDFSKFVVSCRS